MKSLIVYNFEVYYARLILWSIELVFSLQKQTGVNHQKKNRIVKAG